MRMARSVYYAKACDAIAFVHNTIDRYRRQLASPSKRAEECIGGWVKRMLARDNLRFVL
jgi:hypothetical protein